MALYENVFILRQDLSPAQAEGLSETFMELIKQQGGNVASHEYWGLRALAYVIKKNRRGHYFLFNIDASHAAVKEMERQMGINENVLRFLTVRIDALPEGPSAIMKQIRYREENSRDEAETVSAEREE